MVGESDETATSLMEENDHNKDHKLDFDGNVIILAESPNFYKKSANTKIKTAEKKFEIFSVIFIFNTA
jgi:hypothetical protein